MSETVKSEQIGYNIIAGLVPENSRVLDLGCGDGSLLHLLQETKNVKGLGVEISEDNVSLCVEKGLYCFQADIDEGLTDYKDNAFDIVILNQTLQSTKRPDFVIKEIMRIGKKAIISFPNFAYIKIRMQFLFKGSMPVSTSIPFEWYETPNIHMVTIRDFEKYCKDKRCSIDMRAHFNIRGGKTSRARCLPNLFAEYGLFVLNGE